ncbi:hypothetical protein ACIQWN_32625 [Streptomyces vinaceus]|uniref:hypothetical protein n=1 Tax=Streptomyces vinaceus TaxID=1960 RepID=UPI0037F6D55C
MPPRITAATANCHEEGQFFTTATWVAPEDATGWIVQEFWSDEYVCVGAEDPQRSESHYWEAWRVVDGQIQDAQGYVWPDAHDIWTCPAYGRPATRGELVVNATVFWADAFEPEAEGFAVHGDGRRWIARSGPLCALEHLMPRSCHERWDAGFVTAAFGELRRKPRKVDPEFADDPEYRPGEKYDVTSGASQAAREWAATVNVSERLFYHGTTVESARAAFAGGFSLETAKRNGRRQGQAIYLTKKLSEAVTYATGETDGRVAMGAVLAVRYRGSKPVTKLLMERMMGQLSTTDCYTSKKADDAWDLDVVDEKEIAALAQEEGYGAVLLSPYGHLLVFDPHDIEIVDMQELDGEE